ncbi:UNVERIFIED_CONTAM: hypothetical protein K2H54_002067 [Gekko kuhli]
MEVVERPDGQGGAHMLDLLMHSQHLCGHGSGSGKQLIRPAYGAAPQPGPAAAMDAVAAAAAADPTAGADGQAPFHCRIVHIAEPEPLGTRTSPRDSARGHQRGTSVFLQQLRRVLVPGTTRTMHLVADTRTARGGDHRALVTIRADTGHGWSTGPASVTRLAAADQSHCTEADADHYHLEATLRGAHLTDVTDPDCYGGRPRAAPRLGRLLGPGQLPQHCTGAAGAAGTGGPTTPYADCGPAHRARGPRLWAEEGTDVTDHHLLQTAFSPHLLRVLVLRPEAARWAARPPRWRLKRRLLTSARGARAIARLLTWRLALREAAEAEGGAPDTWAEWWQATKAAVATHCRDLEGEAARRGQRAYQAALRRALLAEDTLARGGSVPLARWRRDAAVVSRRWPAGGGPPPDAKEAAYLRAIDRDEQQRRAAWDPATAATWADRARPAASGPPTVEEIRAAIRKGHPDKAPTELRL